MRAKGFAVLNITVVVALIFNQYVNPIALEKLRWKYYIFYVVWLAFELIFVFCYVWETKGRTLEQTAVLFDGDDAELMNRLLGAPNRRRHSRTGGSTMFTRSQNSRTSLVKKTTNEDAGSERFEMKSVDIDWRGSGRGTGIVISELPSAHYDKRLST